MTRIVPDKITSNFDEIQEYEKYFDDEMVDADWNDETVDIPESVEMDLYHHQQLLLGEYFEVKSVRPAFWVRTASKEYTRPDLRGSWQIYIRIYDSMFGVINCLNNRERICSNSSKT